MRDGTGGVSPKVCLLCRDVPMGRDPRKYRATCPGHAARAYLKTELMRVKADAYIPRTRKRTPENTCRKCKGFDDEHPNSACREYIPHDAPVDEAPAAVGLR